MALTKLIKVGKDLISWINSGTATLVEGDNADVPELRFTSGAGEGVSFATEHTNGGASTLHNYTKGVGATSVKGGLTGGYGARPYTGTSYVAHSHTGIHFLADSEITDTNHGGWARLLVTPEGKTIDDRIQALAVSPDGDTVMGKDFPYGKHSLSQLELGGEYDGRGLKQIVNQISEIHCIAPRDSATSIVNFRGTVLDGTATAEGLTAGATQVGSTIYFSMSGHNGAGFEAARAAVAMVATAGWSTTETPTRIIFSTTATGSRTRTDRWSIEANGTLAPSEDNTVDIGSGSARVRQVYAATGTINTSDARLKTDVRPFSAEELAASKLLLQEIGFYKWLDMVSSKGAGARWHCGLTVQRCIEIMQSQGLDAWEYGIVCYDSWDASTEVCTSETTNASASAGEASTIKEVAAGEVFGLRYDELNLFLLRGVGARLDALESLLGAS